MVSTPSTKSNFKRETINDILHKIQFLSHITHGFLFARNRTSQSTASYSRNAGLNTGPETGCPEAFRDFSRSLQENVGIVS
jgi:hypothetical protein